MAKNKSKRNLSSNGRKPSRGGKAGKDRSGATPPNGEKKALCPLAGCPEAVDVLIGKHSETILEIAVKHCDKANSDPQCTKELNPADVVWKVCEDLRCNWANVPEEPRFIKYVKKLIEASPLAECPEVVEYLIQNNLKAMKKIAANACSKGDRELQHVEGFNPDDVTRNVCDKLRRDWAKVPVEPGFFKYVKTVTRRDIASLWQKYLRRTNVFTRFEKEAEKGTADNWSQAGGNDVELHENQNLLDAACLLLRTKKPLVWRAFELREIKGLPRKVVAETMEIKRPATINEYVYAAKEFLVFVLPARADLV